MNGKQFAVATLFALVLLTLVLIPIAHQQGGGAYDPWLDYNGDGKIDVNDLHSLGQAYGTSGDPTRNVNVTNFPLDANGNMKVSVQKEASTSKIGVQEILILDSLSGSYSAGNLLGVYITPAYWNTSDFYFSFDPKPTFVKVTNFYASGVWTSDSNYGLVHTVNYLIDYSTVLSANVSLAGKGTLVGSTNSGPLSSLSPGVHKLTITRAASPITLWLCRLEIFIEYEYQA
jgi:hypothetical protein